MIRLLIIAALALTACSSEPANNTAAAAPAPAPTAPPPMTPTTNITAAPGENPSWLGARPDSSAPETAPYGNLLDQPVVNGAGAR